MEGVISLLAVYYLISNVFQVGFIVLSFLAIRKYRDKNREYKLFIETHPKLPKISFIVPAFNEEPTIVESVKALLRVFYPKTEIIIVNDGSHDQTELALVKAFQFERVEKIPRSSLTSQAEIQSVWRSKLSPPSSVDPMTPSPPTLLLISQKNAGKAQALNTGIDHSTADFIVSLDADTFLEEDCLIRLMPYFMQNSRLVAASGVLRILNGSKVRKGFVPRGSLPFQPLALFQVVEYMRSFYLGRLSWDYLGATLFLSGAFSVYRKDAIRAVGGFSSATITEDFELILRMRRTFSEKKVDALFRLVPYPVCWTQAPESIRHLRKQRHRWQNGLLAALWMHRHLFFASGSGSLGWVNLPYLLIFEALSPLVDLLAISVLSFHHLTSPHRGAHLSQVIAIGLFGVVFSWLVSLMAVHYAESEFRRHPQPLSWKAQGLKAFQFASSTLVGMLLFHPLVAWWKLEALLLFPFRKASWGENPRQRVAEPDPIDQAGADQDKPAA